MPKPIRVFLASPDDVSDERERVQRVIEQLNRSHIASDLDLVIELIRHETHVGPDIGLSDALILEELQSDNWDIFIGILWLKFGTSTTSIQSEPHIQLSSGTEAEFYAAYNRRQSKAERWPRIMVYRCQRPPTDMRNFDDEEYSKVKKFFHDFSPDGKHPGLYREYITPEEFENFVREHLTRAIYDYRKLYVDSEQLEQQIPESIAITDPFTDWSERSHDAVNYFLKRYSRNKEHALENEMDLLNWLLIRKLVRHVNSQPHFTSAGMLLFGPKDRIPFQTDVQISYRNSNDVLVNFDGLPLLVLAERLLEELTPLGNRQYEDPSQRTAGSPKFIPMYPETAIVEAAINLIIHRDYNTGEKAYIDVFDDRVVFQNSGSSIANIEDMLRPDFYRRQPYERNAEIIELFTRTGLNQTQRGGLRRIRTALRENGNTKPDGSLGFDYENSLEDNKFVLTLWKVQHRLHSSIEGLVGNSSDSKRIAVVTGPVIHAEPGSTVFIGASDEFPTTMSAVDRETALGRYLHHVISRNRFLQLQGIRSGGKLVHIELDQLYIRLRTTKQQLIEAEERWLSEEARLAPGEELRTHGGQNSPRLITETMTVKVEEAVADHLRLVVLGDPGSGKTTLLRYLALLYARNLAEGSNLVQTRLVASEPERLPIILPLRQLGGYLREVSNPNVEGHKLLLDFFRRSLANERLVLPEDFFDEWLTNGTAVILLDGLDEVADGDLRRRIARLVESFTAAYPACRYVVTSRIVGYSGAARLGENYTTTTVRDFTLADVRQFLLNWHRLVATGLMGAGASAEAYAQDQTQQLLTAIETNERIRDLAINPLLLTVIALVHRDRVKLPDRRAELYAEAVDVLLGKWDEARGVAEAPIVTGLTFDTGDRRLMLQHVALHMHERQWKEIELAELRLLLQAMFAEIVADARESTIAVDRFLRVIEERSGLLVARGEGIYAFSHLTFQEYLAALALTAQDDYIVATLSHSADGWWREVILLAAGHLSMTSRTRTSQLIQTIAEKVDEPEPYHNLVLAAECLREVGSGRVHDDLSGKIPHRLRAELESLPPQGWLGSVKLLVGRGITAKALAERRIAAAKALAQIGGERFWTMPFGEPEWIEVPAGEFWMGDDLFSDEKLVHKVHLDIFQITRVPITNAQYYLFTQATGYTTPRHWEDDYIPKGLESHPVVSVSWQDALAYCKWLSEVTGNAVTLPSKAQWEKAARGDVDRRLYPWGDKFDNHNCNCSELMLNSTTPVGIFPDGRSPYGCFDMAGNVWEWTNNTNLKDQSSLNECQEGLTINPQTVGIAQGGSWNTGRDSVQCSTHVCYEKDYYSVDLGFRVVCNAVDETCISQAL